MKKYRKLALPNQKPKSGKNTNVLVVGMGAGTCFPVYLEKANGEKFTKHELHALCLMALDYNGFDLGEMLRDYRICVNFRHEDDRRAFIRKVTCM